MVPTLVSHSGRPTPTIHTLRYRPSAWAATERSAYRSSVQPSSVGFTGITRSGRATDGRAALPLLVTSGSARGLGRGRREERERAEVRDAPAVHDLRAERDLVRALEVALAVRVTELDELEPDLALDAPANGVPVAHDGRNVVRGRDRVRRRGAEGVQGGRLGRGAEVGE